MYVFNLYLMGLVRRIFDALTVSTYECDLVEWHLKQLHKQDDRLLTMSADNASVQY
jgi:hypothetical protein